LLVPRPPIGIVCWLASECSLRSASNARGVGRGAWKWAWGVSVVSGIPVLGRGGAWHVSEYKLSACGGQIVMIRL
jgi:hypothetical protein